MIDHEDNMIRAEQAARLKLALLGVPQQTIELLMNGDPVRNIPPGALREALSSAFLALRL